jgi:hypothetical protein
MVAEVKGPNLAASSHGEPEQCPVLFSIVRSLKSFLSIESCDVGEPETSQDARRFDPSRLNLAANFGRVIPHGQELACGLGFHLQ